MADEEDVGGSIPGGRRPARELPVVRHDDGTMLQADVSCHGGWASVSSRSEDGSTPVLDLTGSRFEIGIEVDVQSFHGTGSSGLHTLQPILDQMFYAGYELRCCRTCSRYQPSGMVSQWSFGSKGYCLALGEPDMQHLTHILHVCDLWTGRDGGIHGSVT